MSILMLNIDADTDTKLVLNQCQTNTKRILNQYQSSWDRRREDNVVED